MNWKTLTQLRTMKAFVEGYVFADAVAACEKAPSTTPFKWNTGTKTAVVGLNSVKLDKYTVVRELHAVCRRRLLRLRPDQEEGRYRLELPRAGVTIQA